MDPLRAALDFLSGQSNGQSLFPGLDDIPFVGSGSPLIKRNDPDSRQLRVGSRFHCAVFDVGDEEQRKEYERTLSVVYSLAASGRTAITNIDRQYDSSTRSWRVYLEWRENFTYDANAGHGAGVDVKRRIQE